MERATREAWTKRVERWKDSGLSAREFAAEIGVHPKSLSWWKWQLESKAKQRRVRKARRKAPVRRAISPLTLVEMTPPVRREAFEVLLGNGTTVRVAPDFDADALNRLLEA